MCFEDYREGVLFGFCVFSIAFFESFMNEERKSFMGIDWGSSKIGLAIADPETRIALSFDVIQNDASLLERLGLIFQSERIGTVIIGIPEHSAREGKIFPERQFGAGLSRRFPELVVEYTNEMFTTKMAQDRLKETGGKGISKQDDAEAARIFLEDWLSRDVFPSK